MTSGVEAAGPRFRELQRSKPWWMWAAILAPAAVTWWLALRTWSGAAEEPPLFAALLLVAIVGLALPFWVWRLRLVVEVDDRELRWRMRPLFGLGRSIALEDVVEARARTYRPIAEYWGWGVRWTPGAGWCVTLSGDRGVQLELRDGRRILVGSERCEELAAALDVIPRRDPTA